MEREANSNNMENCTREKEVVEMIYVLQPFFHQLQEDWRMGSSSVQIFRKSGVSLLQSSANDSSKIECKGEK